MTLDPQILSLLAARAAEPAFADDPAAPLEARRAADLARRRAEDAQGEPIGQVDELTIPGPGGELRARLYTPVAEGSSPLPGLLFFHGGGFVFGSVESTGGLCRQLANGATCRVLSVGYRLAPEDPFPAAVEDAYAALKWAEGNSSDLGIDANCLAVGGESAGGNLAAVTSLMARDSGGPKICAQLLLYPVTEIRAKTESRAAPPAPELTDPAKLEMMWDAYLGAGNEGREWQASPLLADDLSRLPETILVTAEYDRFRDEGIAFAQKLKEAGVTVSHSHYAQMIHGFFGFAGKVEAARSAIAETAQELRTLFEAL